MIEFLIGALVGGLTATLLIPQPVSRSMHSLAVRSIKKLISARKDGAR